MFVKMGRLKTEDAGKWVICPASVQLQEFFPKNDYAELTAVRWMAQEILNSYKNSESSIILANKFKDEIAPNSVLIDDEMIESVDLYTNDVLSIMNACGGIRYLNIEKTRQSTRIHPTENETICNADFYDPKTKILRIWCLEYQHSCINAFENWSAICQASSVLEELAKDPKYDDRKIQVIIRVIQPRDYQSGEFIKEWSIMASDLRGYINTAHNSAGQALNANPKALTGSHCAGCSALAYCHAAYNASTNAIDFISTMNIQVIPPDKLKIHREHLQRGLEAIKLRLNAINADIEGRIRNNEIINGLTLEMGRGNLAWTIPDEQVLLIGQAMGVNLKKGDKPITPTQAKKLIDESVIEQYSHRPLGKAKIVDSDDTIAFKTFGK